MLRIIQIHFFVVSFSFLLGFGVPEVSATAPLDSFNCGNTKRVQICVDRFGATHAYDSFRYDRELLNRLSLTLAEMERVFAAKLTSPPKVVLLTSQRLSQLTSAPKWASALYQEKTIYITVGPKAKLGREKIARSFRHEIVHMFVAELSRGRAPAWFDEGLAMYLSGDGARLRRKAKVPYDLTGLHFKPEHRTFLRLRKANARAVYLEVDSLVQSLVFRKGFSAVRSYLGALRRGADKDTEFEKIFGQFPPKLP